jgi:hypothetical protein
MMMEFNFYPDSSAAELLRLLPPVLRARDFHLYLEGGRRITDLWQIGGRAVLGHKPPQVIKEQKNTAERGLFAPFPHHSESRFLKALAQLFPLFKNGKKNCFRLYNSEKYLEKALHTAGFSSPEPILTPMFPGPKDNESQLLLWRPFLGTEINRPLLIPVLPWAFSPIVLVLEETLDERFAPGDLLPPVILAAGARAIYDLIAIGDNGGRPEYYKIKKALAKGKMWQRQGIYLYRKSSDHEGDTVAHNDWPSLWKHFLEQGFLLPPSPKEPLILPGILSPGEEAKLAALLSHDAPTTL